MEILNQHYPNFDEFKQLATKGNLVPVYRQLLADTLTPVSAFQKISEADVSAFQKIPEAEYAFLLESAAGGEKFHGIPYLAQILLWNLRYTVIAWR